MAAGASIAQFTDKCIMTDMMSKQPSVATRIVKGQQQVVL